MNTFLEIENIAIPLIWRHICPFITDKSKLTILTSI